MRQLIEATLKDRHQIELNQREAVQEVPQQLTKQYQAVIEEYGKKIEVERVEKIMDFELTPGAKWRP